MAKVQSMSVKDFMGGKEWSTKKKFDKTQVIGLASGVATMTAFLPQGLTAHAETLATPVMVNVVTQPVMGGVVAGVSAAKIAAALTPLLNLIQSLAFPITTIIITGACLLYMINKDKATTMMINAIVGYFLVQLAPLFMKILVECAKAM